MMRKSVTGFAQKKIMRKQKAWRKMAIPSERILL